jgi:hypothetical protein
MKTLCTRIMQVRLLLGFASFAAATSAWAAGSAPFDIASIGRQQYKVDDYIRAAVTLQAMGGETACQTLLASAEAHPTRDYDVCFFVLCRMLFMQRGTNEFRAPIAGLNYLVEDVPDFRLAPIELVDGIPFLLVGNGPRGGSFRVGEGATYNAQLYLRYCLNNCDWSTNTFREATARQKSDALAKFLASETLKRSVSNKVKRPSIDFDYAKKFFSAQIE